MAALATVLAWSWDPEFRGITSVGIGVVVLMGSVWLLLFTNVGARLAFLVSATAFFGWMVIMGAVWWVYGIGLQGTFPSWQPVEVVQGELALATTPEVQDLSDWEQLSEDDPGRGQAQASADEILLEQTETFSAVSDYQSVDVYQRGGETGPWWLFNIFHEPKHALVQVQRVIPQEAEPGRAPPAPVLDPDQPVTSVVMVRDLGDRRFPPEMITLGSAILFGLFASALHRRDKLATANRTGALVPAATRS